MESMSESDESFHSTVDPINCAEEPSSTNDNDRNEDEDDIDETDEPVPLVASALLTPEPIVGDFGHSDSLNHNNNPDLSLTDDSEVSVIYVENQSAERRSEKKNKKSESQSGSNTKRGSPGVNNSDKGTKKYLVSDLRALSVSENNMVAGFLNSFEELRYSCNVPTTPLLQEENGIGISSSNQNNSKPRLKESKKSAKSNGQMNGICEGATGLYHEQPVSDIQLIYRRLDLQFSQLKELTELMKETNRRIEKLERRNNDVTEDAEDDTSTLCDMDNLHGIPPANPKLNVRTELPTQLSKTIPVGENTVGAHLHNLPLKPIPKRSSQVYSASSRNFANPSSSHATNFSESSNGSMLNNQIPPGARTNNFVDNFRSNTHQNMLSSPKSNATVESQRHMNDISSQESLDAFRNENSFGTNAKSSVWETPTDSSSSKKWGNCFVQNVGGKKRNKDQQGLCFTKFQTPNGSSNGTRRSDGSGRSRSPLEMSVPGHSELPQSQFCPQSNAEAYGPYSRLGLQQEVLDYLNKFLVLNEGRTLFLSSLFRKLCELRSEFDRERALSALSFVNWDVEGSRGRCMQPPETRAHMARNMCDNQSNLNDFFNRSHSQPVRPADLDFPINNSFAGVSPMNDFKNRNVLGMDDFGYNFFGSQNQNSFSQPQRFVIPSMDGGITENKCPWNVESPYVNSVNGHEMNQNRNCRQPSRGENLMPLHRSGTGLTSHSNEFHDVQQSYPFNLIRSRETPNSLILQTPPRPSAVSRSNLPMEINFNNSRQNFGFSSDAYLNNSRPFRHTKSDSQSSGSCSGLAQSISELSLAIKRKENQQVRESQGDVTNPSNEPTGYIDSLQHYNGNDDTEGPGDEWDE